ncbi:hypothetical protein PCANC_12021 [Puccinia coronata f. sp. avenae]|uniref:Uncharacterized protein n=1 Tax=Puccinia coronata f. sp. avenae TaxID=200324 RepID=A0A2N5UUG6_9BASI|nr:hypothetical protein PCANC_12021 [Puccinia coronata f. sp. avenae]
MKGVHENLQNFLRGCSATSRHYRHYPLESDQNHHHHHHRYHALNPPHHPLNPPHHPLNPPHHPLNQRYHPSNQRYHSSNQRCHPLNDRHYLNQKNLEMMLPLRRNKCLKDLQMVLPIRQNKCLKALVLPIRQNKCLKALVLPIRQNKCLKDLEMALVRPLPPNKYRSGAGSLTRANTDASGCGRSGTAATSHNTSVATEKVQTE